MRDVILKLEADVNACVENISTYVEQLQYHKKTIKDIESSINSEHDKISSLLEAIKHLEKEFKND